MAGTFLSRATLGYVAVITAIITLAPLRFSSVPAHGLTALWTVSDIVMNIVMFVPLGFLYALAQPRHGASASAGSSDRSPWRRHAVLLRALGLGALFSAFIETAQLFEAERFSSLYDVATNAVGALVGAALHRAIAQRISTSNALRSLALELPLMGLLYLFVPMMWLAGLSSEDTGRAWLVLLIAAGAGGILGSVHAGYGTATRLRNLWYLTGATLAWYAVAIVPSAVRDEPVMLAGAGLAVGAALLRSIATRRARLSSGSSRRFELPTLRLVLPLFAAYVALSSLWPLDAPRPDWYAGIALMPPDMDTGRTQIFLALEHVAAFTLIGYIIAEFHGRELTPYRVMIPRVVGWGGSISLMLELTRGVHPAYRASAVMFALTLAASAFGGWMYHLQREHVRAVNASR